MHSTNKESIFTELASLIAENQADELESKQQLLLPRDHYIKQKTTALLYELERENKELLEQMAVARHILSENLQILPPEEQGYYAKEFLTAMDKLTHNVEIKQVVTEDSWQSLLGFSNKTMFWIYSLGYKLFEEKNYKEALSLFLMLTVLNSMVPDNWVALGLTQKNLSLENLALSSFNTASILNPENPTSRYQSAEIYLHLGEFDKALIELEALSQIIESQKLESLRPQLKFLQSKAKNKQIA